MNQDRNIKYVAREFTEFRENLIQYAKNYFPDSYNDFSEASPGLMFIEMAAYVGDILSFYQDTQLQETYLQYAKNPANLFNLAYMMGYRPKVTTVSEVEVEISQRVGAVPGTNKPNWNQALSLSENTVVTSTTAGSPKFFLNNRIDFTFSSSYDPTDIQIYSLDNNTQVPLEFLLTKKAKATSGEIISTTRTFTEPEKFATITIEDSSIVGILDIVDENSNRWYEVPFLGQETIFIDEINNSTDSNSVPYITKLQRVPRRFITRLTSQGNLEIQFGAGVTGQADNEFTPDPTNVGLGSPQGITTLDKAYDPSNFLYTQTYGLAPSNTTLTIRYLKGGGISANIPANTLTEFNTTVTAPDLTFEGTLQFNNPTRATGGKDGDTVEELRQNALRAFAEQGRTVTINDYNVRAMSLPSKYGSIGKVLTVQDQLTSNQPTTDGIIDSNPLSLSMYVLAYDNNRKLITASSNLKNNLKNYLGNYKIDTDAVNIKDPFIVNIGVMYDILTRPNFNGRDVLLNCNTVLREYFDIRKWNINQPINLSSIYTLLDKVPGVQTVNKVEIKNLVNNGYSTFAYDIKGATRNNIVYPSLDMMIFEVKFPDIDIKGRTTTL